VAAEDLHELVGQYRDEEVAIHPPLLVVEYRAQAEFVLEAAEHRLQVGEHGVGAPQPLGIPVGLVAAQAVDAGVGEPGSGLGLAFPAQLDGLLPTLVRDQFDA
jgi:hypothetical protein